MGATKRKGTSQDHYDTAACAYIDDATNNFTFTVPRNTRPGTYLLSPIGPPWFTRIETGPPKKVVTIDPAKAGPRSEGTLPRLTVMP